jgi:hypothetical protein
MASVTEAFLHRKSIGALVGFADLYPSHYRLSVPARASRYCICAVRFVDAPGISSFVSML